MPSARERGGGDRALGADHDPIEVGAQPIGARLLGGIGEQVVDLDGAGHQQGVHLASVERVQEVAQRGGVGWPTPDIGSELDHAGATRFEGGAQLAG